MQRDVRKRVPQWLASVTLALVVGGCGGGSQSSTATPTAARNSSAATQPSHAQGGSTSPPGGLQGGKGFIAGAERICQRVNREIIASEYQNLGASQAVQLREIVEVVPAHAALERRAQDELAKLKPPATLVADWRAMLAYRGRLAAQLDELVVDAKRKDMKAIAALTPGKKEVHSLLRAVARKHGLKECGEVGPGPATPQNIAPQSPL